MYFGRVLAALILAAGSCSQAAAQSRLYVDATAAPGGNGGSWSTAFTDLQAAIQASSQLSINEIWVADGVYTPDQGTGDPNRTFTLRSGLRLVGGFAGGETAIAQRNAWRNQTVLSGTLSGGSSYHVVTALGANNQTLLDGFHIAGGRALGSGAHAAGGGVRAEQSQLQISNCVFRDNHAVDGGAAYFFESAVTVVNCVVTGNLATDGVAGLFFASGFQTGFNAAVVNCTVSGNRAVARSRAVGVYGGMSSGWVQVRNCVLWENTYTVFANYPGQMGGRIDGAYCCLSQSSDWPGAGGGTPTGILYTDPMMVLARGDDGVFGTADDNPQLRVGSPCIDGGDASALPSDTFDLDGDGNTSEPLPIDLNAASRSYDDPNSSNVAGAVDIGAIEGPVFSVVASSQSLPVPEGSSSSIQVRLSRAPSGSAGVALQFNGDPDLTSTTTNLTFTTSDWNTYQPVQVSAAEDQDSFQSTSEATFSTPGGLSALVTAQELENDAPPGIVYVNGASTGAQTGASWATPFRTIQAALTYAAGSGGAVQEIWVAAGVYKPVAASYFLVNGVGVYGGFAGTESNREQRNWVTNITVLSGDTLGDDGPNFTNREDNKGHVVRATACGLSTRLDGFVIRGGDARNASDTMGGGVYLTFGDRPTIANCTFTDNRARHGGGMYCKYSGTNAPALQDCLFVANLADDGSNGYGGGLSIAQLLSPGTGLEIKGCTFVDNRAKDDGGGLWLSVSNAELEDCSLVSNGVTYANGFGAGAWIDLDSEDGLLSLANCQFQQHATQENQQGAGLYLVGRGTASFDGCEFTENVATSNTSALRIQQSVSSVPLRVTILDSRFNDNVGGFGGAIYMVATLQLMDRCEFIGNTGGSGGAGAFSGLIRNTTFANNTSAHGGALRVDAAGRLENCTFVDNTATASSTGTPLGGGAVVAQDGPVFTDCVFRGNRATGANASGGAILAENGVRLARCTFVDNEAHFGGAIRAGETAWVFNSVLLGNAASQGGAFYGNGIFANSAVIGNSADSVGGGFYGTGAQGRTLILRNCTVAGNDAPVGAGVYMFNQILECRNSVLWGNRPTGGSGLESEQLLLGATASGDCSYSTVQGWTGSLGGSGNNGNDAVFFDLAGPDDILGTQDDDASVWSGSACIDSGSNALAQPDLLDLNGNLNITEPISIDVAGLARFLDDPQTSDTGAGTAPIIDRGAAEFERPSLLYVPCYANCDESTASPVLNVADFACFLQRFATASAYANCDGSTAPPVLNVADFTCFLQRFAAGCP